MKVKYIYSAMMAAVFAVALTACSNENDMPEPEQKPKETTPITLSTDTVKVGVGESSTFNITAGGGDYKLIVENPDIASATIAGNAVTVKSAVKGKTGIIVSDATGNYKRVIVKSMYTKISLDKEEVKVGMKIGHTDGLAEVTVISGNGGYEAVSDHEDVARIKYVRENVVTITGVKNGSATITITDMMGLTKTVKVTVETTDVAYSEEEKAKIMQSTQETITFDESPTPSWGTMDISEDDGKWLAQWSYYGESYLKCWFEGDLTVGKKTGGRVESKDSYWNPLKAYDNVNVEILKVTDTHVWGIMSVLKDDYLHYGYFCLPKVEAKPED
ncbi:hypothetical protein JHU38_00695 [Prevotella sp. A2931]|uniref:Pilus formation protein N-terminal domain-containing protein n=1 Tax=Prevotella illustrans TaxID=2800387 RepID=A0ABS3M2A1_9BACT|nr:MULTISPECIES: hypothetical protein [Prevotella]MBO1362312.1 hypothetical protein [Prevotella illustrans]